MGTINVSVIEMLFQSSSISKGIEKTLDYIGDTYAPDSIAIIELNQDNVSVSYEWKSSNSQAEVPDYLEYISICEVNQHFYDTDVFFREDFTNLSEKEQRLYTRCNAKAVLECAIMDVGKTIGYVIYLWSDLEYAPNLTDMYDLQILTKLIGENIRREIVNGKFIENEVNTVAVLNGLKNTSVYVIDDNYKLLYVNDTFREYMSDICIGDTCYRAIMKKDSPCRSCQRCHVDEGEDAECLVYVPFLDKKVNIAMNDIVYAGDKEAYVVACTEQKDKEDVKSKEKMFRKLALTLQSKYLTILDVNYDKDTYIDTSKSEGEEGYTGSFTTEFLPYFEHRIDKEQTKDFFDMFDIAKLDNEFKKGNMEISQRFKYRMNNGESRWIGIRVSMVAGVFDVDRSCFVCFRDVNEEQQRKIEEDNKIQSDMLTTIATSEAKGTLLANLSHDIKTPINNITAMTSIAKKKLEDRAAIEECIDSIDKASRYLIDLVDGMLDMSQIDSDEFELSKDYFDFNKMISDIDIIVRPKADEKLIGFNIKKSIHDGNLYGDKYRLNQVIVNLLNLAINYMDRGENITLTIEKVAGNKQKSFYRISIAGTGKAISMKVQKQLFKAFDFVSLSAAKQLGETEFQMVLCNKIIRNMGGNININSTGDNGYDIYFTVELGNDRNGDNNPSNKAKVVSDSVEENISFEGMKALVAEDEDMNADTMVALLSVVGFEVDTVKNGKLAVINYIAKKPNYYDVIFMDLHMPVMDGRDAAKCIRISGKDDANLVPIIGLAANIYTEDEKKTIASGMNTHMTKPIDVEVMYKTITKLIIERREKEDKE